MNRNEFYQKAMTSKFGDAMVFQLNNTNSDPEITFSREAVDAVIEQLKDFVWARVFARYKHTNQGPKQLRLELKVDWFNEPEQLLEKGEPWYNLVDFADGLSRIDGKTRLQG